jgi:HEPN domain-containing protein
MDSGVFGEVDNFKAAVTWFRQAQRDLRASEKSFADRDYPLSTQQARAAAEKALKAAWILVSEEVPDETHSVMELARLVAMDDLVEEAQSRVFAARMPPEEEAARRSRLIAEAVINELKPKLENK